MNAEEAIKIVRKIAGNVFVSVTTTEWHMNHLDGDGINLVEYRVSIQPGIGGERCNGWSGESIIDCVDKAFTDIIRSGFHADKKVGPDMRHPCCGQRSCSCGKHEPSTPA